MTLVWVTRASPGAEQTAARVTMMGLQAVVAPLLETMLIGQGPIDLNGVAALAFTSANGVRAFAARCDERDRPVFAVGDGTASAARLAGFDDVRSARGDVAALARAIAGAARNGRRGVVLHPGAAEPAGDLVGSLATMGVVARALPLYRTSSATLSAAVLATIPSFDAALVHSPKAARALAAVLAGHAAPGLVAVCLSSAVAAPLAAARLAGSVASAAPTEAALLALLADMIARA